MKALWKTCHAISAKSVIEYFDIADLTFLCVTFNSDFIKMQFFEQFLQHIIEAVTYFSAEETVATFKI